MFGLSDKTTDVGPHVALAKRRAELAKVCEERQRLRSAADRASADRARARGALDRLMNNAEAFTDASTGDLARAKRAHQNSRDTEAAANAALAEHEAAHDIAARTKELDFEAEFLEQQALRVAHREDVANLVKLGSELKNLEARMVSRLRDAQKRWPENSDASSDGRILAKQGGIFDVGLPPGIFHPADNAGPLLIWPDHVLHAIGIHYPDLLPTSQAEETLARIASQKARGVPRKFADAVLWSIYQRRFA
jgi:hypothetical protein